MTCVHHPFYYFWPGGRMPKKSRLETTIGFRVTREQKRLFKAVCERHGIDQTDVIFQLWHEWMETKLNAEENSRAFPVKSLLSRK